MTVAPIEGSPPPRPAWPRVGEISILEAALGARGEGKTAYQCVRVWESLHEWGGGYVIGHSLGRRLPRQLPPSYYGGPALPITYYSTIKALDAGLRRHPDRWHILAPPSGAEARALGIDPASTDTADDLLRYAEDLALQVRRAAWWRENPWHLWMPRQPDYTGLRCPPVLVIIDEGVAVQAAKKNADAAASGKYDWFTDFLISLRHNHIALWYAVQNPNLRSWKVLEQSTAIHVFHLSHEWALNSVRAAGASKEQIGEIAHLRRFEHVTIHPIRSEAPQSDGKPPTETLPVTDKAPS